MIFKRILHPVGQGAFFTEQFLDENGTSVLNVVYDCGEMRSTKHLNREIENTLNPTGNVEVVDFLFISHLDEDHISGIDHLINIGSLTDKSVVILPFNYPLVIKVLLLADRYFFRGQFSTGVTDILFRLFATGAKILGIDNNTEAIINSDATLENLRNMNDGSVVKSLQPLRFKNLWYYIPFNTILDDDRYVKFVDALRKAKISKSQLTDATYVQKHMNELIDIYRNLPKGIGNVTAINVNSLNVFSYSANNIEYRGEWFNYFGVDARYLDTWYDYLLYRSRCSCLYTGDCVMEPRLEHCMDLLVSHISSYIGMLQIPHHGRQGNYNAKIASKNEILSGFTNFNSMYKANKFVKRIVQDFSMSGRMFFQITEQFHSRMELYVHLCVWEKLMKF